MDRFRLIIFLLVVIILLLILNVIILFYLIKLFNNELTLIFSVIKGLQEQIMQLISILMKIHK